MTTEFTRIAQYFAPLAGEAGRGLIDDAAVLTPPPGREIVLTVDQMLEGIHFLPADPPDFIARKLLRRNLSDLAAMGATPLSYLLTTALPPHIGESWLAAFAEGLRQDQEEYKIHLIGGDSASSQQHISLTATLLGHVAPGAALGRNGAQGGDEIWVTGTIGDAALGLRARRGQLTQTSIGNVSSNDIARSPGSGAGAGSAAKPSSTVLTAAQERFLIQRSLLPSPRINLALAGIANAAIDISDGLPQDLGHICQASGLAATIHAALVPASAAAALFADEFLEARLTDGDDYELLLAVPPEKAALLTAACGDLPVTKIGVFSPGNATVRVLNRDGTPITFAKPGWQHF
jgi:thiamine-monophosphate kinase